MKQIIIILLVSFAFGQTKYVQDSKIIELDMFLDYAKECYNDTLKIDRYLSGRVITILDSLKTDFPQKNGVKELNRLGWIKIYEDSEYYYFIKNPTFQGFINWIRSKQ